MKKILVIALLGFISLEAYNIKNTHWADSGSNRHKVYSIQCNNGNNTITQYYPSSNTYHASGGRAYSTLNQAVNSSCGAKSHSSKNKYKKLAQASLYCKNKSTMIRILKDDFEYSMAGLGGQSRNSDCGNASKVTNVIVVKMYDGKSQGLIDDYARIKAGNGHYYVKKSELLKR